jgi:hypothetical protein
LPTTATTVPIPQLHVFVVFAVLPQSGYLNPDSRGHLGGVAISQNLETGVMVVEGTDHNDVFSAEVERRSNDDQIYCESN